ncbi:MAG: methylase, partial [Paludibacteraceae bacterium]|nr:methylase [Paludibacteraceae bacterium]
MTTQDKAQQAEVFAQDWAEKGDEKQHTQSFWITFLRDVVGVSQPEKVIDFEKRVKIDNIKYIDAYIAETRVAIEQKGAKIDLDKPEKQSDGEELTPFEQAKRYNDNLPFSEKCRWIVVCNFKEFRIHDMEQTEPAKHFETILLEELPKQYHRFQFLIDPKNENIRREEQISVEAGKLVDKLYLALLPQYKNPNETALRSLNILCVRIVFCLY